MRVVLASASPARLEVLRRAGVSAEAIVSGVDEAAIEVDPPGEATSGRRDGRRDRPRETGREPVKVTPPPPPPPVDPGPGSATPAGGSGAGSGSAKKPKDTKVDPTVTIDPFAGGG